MTTGFGIKYQLNAQDSSTQSLQNQKLEDTENIKQLLIRFQSFSESFTQEVQDLKETNVCLDRTISQLEERQEHLALSSSLSEQNKHLIEEFEHELEALKHRLDNQENLTRTSQARRLADIEEIQRSLTRLQSFSDSFNQQIQELKETNCQLGERQNHLALSSSRSEQNKHLIKELEHELKTLKNQLNTQENLTQSLQNQKLEDIENIQQILIRFQSFSESFTQQVQGLKETDIYLDRTISQLRERQEHLVSSSSLIEQKTHSIKEFEYKMEVLKHQLDNQENLVQLIQNQRLADIEDIQQSLTRFSQEFNLINQLIRDIKNSQIYTPLKQSIEEVKNSLTRLNDEIGSINYRHENLKQEFNLNLQSFDLRLIDSLNLTRSLQDTTRSEIENIRQSLRTLPQLLNPIKEQIIQLKEFQKNSSNKSSVEKLEKISSELNQHIEMVIKRQDKLESDSQRISKK